MRNNIIFLNIGFTITIILLFLLIFKEKKSNSIIKYYEKENQDIIVSNKIIMKKIRKLESEIIRLNEENEKISKEYKKQDLNTYINEDINDNFKQVLNYKFFKEKNSSIIDLYEEGKAKEEIAKILNKSIREIEMVINLIK